MKNLIIIILILFANSISAQSLSDIYKKATVKLIPDKEYAQNNDWEKVFETYYDTINGSPIENKKSIILMPNGSLIVNHTNRNFYSMFDPSGKFVKEFGINKSGQQMKKAENISGIMNNTFFTEVDNLGKMVCFDFDGNYVKTLTLNYSVRDMISLPDNKIAVVGWAVWTTKTRDFIAIVDYNINEQKVIWEHFTERTNVSNSLFRYRYTFKNGGSFSITTMPYTWNSPPLISYVKNRLIVTLPDSGEILIYNTNGTLISKDKVEWATKYLSVEDQKEILKRVIEKYKTEKIEIDPVFLIGVDRNSRIEEYNNAIKGIIIQMENNLNRITDPIPIPAFMTIIKDSDDNLLFFEMPEERGVNKFNVWVYNDVGKFLCQSSFVCDEYNLSITPSKMVFHNGYIYGLQKVKNADGNPLRLVRFKITYD